MNNTTFCIEEAVMSVTSTIGTRDIAGAVILGSGLSPALDSFSIINEISYSDIQGFGSPKVPGHAGKLLLLENNILAFSGRRHIYEGISVSDLGNAVQLAHGLRAKFVCSFCAVGSLHERWNAGTLVSITDHINFTGRSPLVGGDDSKVVFPSLSDLYMHTHRNNLVEKLDISDAGVYAYMPGPQYETPAESRMLKMLGADVVGMSLVPEGIMAATLKIAFFGFGCVTNHAPGIGNDDAEHSIVVENAGSFTQRIAEIITVLPRLDSWR